MAIKLTNNICLMIVYLVAKDSVLALHTVCHAWFTTTVDRFWQQLPLPTLSTVNYTRLYYYTSAVQMLAFNHRGWHWLNGEPFPLLGYVLLDVANITSDL